MRRFLVGFLATVGAVTLIVVGVLGGVTFWLVRTFGEPPGLPDAIVLTVDLGQALSEARPRDPFASLSLQQPLEVTELVLALERASRDPRVKGLVARLDATTHGFAVAQELRDAVRDFARSGKATAAWADSFGELGPGNEGYFIATAFDSVHLQPGGLLGLTGLMAEVPFVRPLLERLGIEAQLTRRSAYKTAFDSVIETGLTEANREMLTDLLDGLYATLVGAIAEARGQTPATVERLIDRGPLFAEEALAAGLVDSLAFRDEVLDRVLEDAGPEAEFVGLDLYARRTAGAADDALAVIALVVGQGAIQRGSSGFEQLIGGDDLADQLAAAREDDEITAVVLRLDSGGGSAVASETIAREVALLREAGKPVVVSMSNAAASGGYWIAMGASHIVAQPTTLTGSIGVIAGKPVLAEAWDHLGVTWESVERGRNAGFLSLNRPFDELGRARLEATVDALYERFKAGVAAGRGLDPTTVESVAQGRVWLGEQALDHGLVDELGGLPTARAAAVRLLDLPADAPVELRRYPERPPAWEQLLELFDQPWIELAATLRALWRGIGGTGPVEVELPRFR